MATQRIIIGWLALATGLALLWYPLKLLREMQIGSSQLLFYAFAAASVCTAPCLLYQVKNWRHASQALLTTGLSGAVCLTFLQFSLIGGDPQSVMSLFCLLPVAIMLVTKVLSQKALSFGVFAVLLIVVIASLTVFFMSATELRLGWSEVAALLSGLACYWLFRVQQRSALLPVFSKLASVMICSTWLVGMVIIFSPRLVSFPMENATLLSVFYGVVCLIPVTVGVLFVFSQPKESILPTWLGLVLLVTTLSVAILGLDGFATA